MNQSELALARHLGDVLVKRGWFCAVAESCTGGRLAAAITEVPGSSKWFDRGFITYTNQSKMDMLGVSQEQLDLEGAVSEMVVREMAEGALSVSQADITVAISGIAGPAGGSADKPVGLVWFAWSLRHGPTHTESYCFQGGRTAVRTQAVAIGIERLIMMAERFSV